jgi:hypothetical protein
VNQPAGFAALYLQDRVEGSLRWFTAMARRRRRRRARLTAALVTLLVLAAVGQAVNAILPDPSVTLSAATIILALAALALLPGLFWSTMGRTGMYADTVAALEEAASTGRQLIRGTPPPADQLQHWVSRVEDILAAADSGPDSF